MSKSLNPSLLAEMPLVSVVMPSLNQAAYIEIAIRSVLEQSYPNVELLVVDGLSNDGTQEILIELQKEYGGRLQWTSQKDGGPAQAINTAFTMARGDLIGWLNSDDMYAQDAIMRAVSYFIEKPQHQLVYGFAQHINSRGDLLGYYPTKSPSTTLDHFLDACFICQPSAFMRKRALDEVGVLDESIQTAFDFDLWLRFFKRYPRQIGFIRRIQAYSRLHANCLTQRARRQVALDGMQVLTAHLKKVPTHWFWTYIDKLCDDYLVQDSDLSLIKQLEAFILLAKKYFSPNDLEEIRLKLRGDQRFLTSKLGLAANIQADGWVSKELIVKYRWEDKPVKAINVHCAPSWPIHKNMKLQIQLPQGGIQEVKVSTDESFILNLEVPDFDRSGFIAWRISTSQSFIPARLDKKSKDTRRLSFKVLDLTFI